MYAQLSLVISLHLFILLKYHAHSQSDYEKFYLECNKTFNCGENVKGIGYPFWGGGRPPHCGLPGLNLSCENDDEDFATTLDIGSDTKFRVLYINMSSYEIAMEREPDDILPCPQKILNSAKKFIETKFGYGPNTGQGSGDLHLFYCPLEWLNMPVVNLIRIRNNFTCESQGFVGFFGNETLLQDFPILHDCKIKVGIPVNRTVLEELGKNEMMELKDLLSPSFVVYYGISEKCSACVSSGGLCWSGINPTDPPCLCRDGAYRSTCPKQAERKGALPMKIGIGFGAALTGILLMCFIYYIRKSPNTSLTFFRRKTKNDRDVEAFIRQYGSSITKRYTYYDVRKITNSFKYELGKGGYGNVFKGKLPGGRVVAVKVLNVSKGKGEEFINEVASIGRTSHINVVTLLGFCYEGRKRALIYEFMPNGSLEKFIYGKISLMTRQNLGWKKLYDIALGIARGLEYLHCGCNTRILHLDIKPHNILLDEDFSPKISDFGLAKLYTRKESIISTIEARGTIGYIAPEVFSRNFGGVSHKSDVYSYGMMILEMAGGRKNVDVGVIRTSEIYFPHWIYKRIELDEELDLATEMTVEENEVARKMMIVGLWCIQTDPSQRPSITKVIEMLEGSISALEIPPKPYLCSPRRSASNSSPKAVTNSPPGS